MNPPSRQQQPLTPKQLETLERAKKKRFAGILAALDANSAIRERAMTADPAGPAPAPRAEESQQETATINGAQFT